MDLPEGGLLDSKYDGMSSEQIYELLPDIPEVTCYVGFGDVDDAPEGPMEEGYEEIEREIKQLLVAAANTARLAGKLPGHLERFVGDQIKAVIPWREVLARFLTISAKDDYSFNRPNSRYLHSGYYLPSLRSETLGEIYFFVDTSGSISNEELNKFAAEMRFITDQFRKTIEVLYIDTEVAGTQTLEPGDIDQLEAQGGGGTDFCPGFDYLIEHDIKPLAVIYYTDGYCSSFPAIPDYEVLWAVYGGNHSFDPPFGEVLHIED